MGSARSDPETGSASWDPAIYAWRTCAEAGGLMSYGTNDSDSYPQVGVSIGKILNGARPADLPVIGPTTYEHQQIGRAHV